MIKNPPIIGISFILSAIIVYSMQRQTDSPRGNAYRVSLKQSIEVRDWSVDTTINQQKRNYLERIYANSSN